MKMWMLFCGHISTWLKKHDAFTVSSISKQHKHMVTVISYHTAPITGNIYHIFLALLDGVQNANRGSGCWLFSKILDAKAWLQSHMEQLHNRTNPHIVSLHYILYTWCSITQSVPYDEPALVTPNFDKLELPTLQKAIPKYARSGLTSNEILWWDAFILHRNAARTTAPRCRGVVAEWRNQFAMIIGSYTSLTFYFLSNSIDWDGYYINSSYPRGTLLLLQWSLSTTEALVTLLVL